MKRLRQIYYAWRLARHRRWLRRNNVILPAPLPDPERSWSQQYMRSIKP
jgi:hypothetical protein